MFIGGRSDLRESSRQDVEDRTPYLRPGACDKTPLDHLHIVTGSHDVLSYSYCPRKTADNRCKLKLA